MAFLDYDGLSLFKTLIDGKLDEKTDMIYLNQNTWSEIWSVLDTIPANKAYVLVTNYDAALLITRNNYRDYLYGLIIRSGTDSFRCIMCARSLTLKAFIFEFSGNSTEITSYSEKNLLTSSNIYNALNKDAEGFALDARQGKNLDEKKLDKTSVYNGLDKTDTGYALDAKLGKTLNDGKLDKTSVYNGLDKTATGFALDASQGKFLNDNKLDKTSVYNGLDKTASGFALDARQGKSLSDTLATKARYIALESTDNTWAKIWAKLNLMEAGDVATIYISNDAFDIISAGARNSGQPSGVVFRSSSTGF